ncbi:MAG: hypothetical protein U9Q66_03735 [Patescibacteria group bacterium]|nr:hypothetical protein [Patescibacteria group bacterium]
MSYLKKFEKATKKAFSDIGDGLGKVLSPDEWKSDEWKTAGAVLVGGSLLNAYGVPGTESRLGQGFLDPVTDSVSDYFDTGTDAVTKPAVNAGGKATIEDLYGAQIANLNKTPPWYDSTLAEALTTGSLAYVAGEEASKAEAKAQEAARKYEKEATALATQNTAAFDLANKGFAQDVADNQSKFLYGDAFNSVNPYTGQVASTGEDGTLVISNNAANTGEGLSTVDKDYALNSTTTDEPAADGLGNSNYYNSGYMGLKAKADADLMVRLQNLKNIPAITSANAAATNAGTNSRAQDQSEDFVGSNYYSSYGV